MKYFFILIFSIILSAIQAQEEAISLQTETGTIHGTLLVPNTSEKAPVALIISGSGPTDRDGNNTMMSNNSLKMLAEALLEKGIASVRFDKRGVAGSAAAAVSEMDLRFENYVNDVKAWCKLIKGDNRFGDLIVIGHSEGSLIGMIAAQEGIVDKLVSLAGAGFSAADVIREQLKSQPPMILDPALEILEQLENGELVDSVPILLQSIFRPSVQPYIISWFKYDPQAEIKKLKIPVLIAQGDTDIQVSLKDADMLSKANQEATKIIIKGMNHILKEVEVDRMKNLQTYNNPSLPIVEELVDAITDFINAE